MPSHSFDIDKKLSEAINCHRTGQLQKAAEIYNMIINVSPDHADALHLLGLIFYKSGNNNNAVDLIERAIKIMPNNPYYYNNLGVIMRDLGSLDEAVDCYKKAVNLKKDYAEPYNNIGLIFHEKRMTGESVRYYEKALSFNPNYAEAYYNMGNSLKSIKKFDQAISCYKNAIKVRPNYQEALLNMGNLLQDQEKFNDALLCYRQALNIKPDYAEAYYNMGNALKNLDKLNEALSHYDKALEIKPDYPEVLDNKGIIFKEQGRLDDSISSYRKAIKLRPDYTKVHSDLLFTMQYEPRFDNRTLFIEARAWGEKQESFFTKKTFYNQNQLERRLKIGYVSPDFHEHSVSYFFLPVIEAHDHERFELFCYYESNKEDNITRKIKDHSDHWRITFGISDNNVVAQIIEDEIDILVDLAGHTANNRLGVFAQKPAPVQVTWLGYPNTTGLSQIDYRLTDKIADPEGETDEFNSEILIRLPHGFLCYAPFTKKPEISPLPVKTKGTITFGSFNNLSKVNEWVIETWSDIMNQVPDSTLLLKSKQLADDFTRNRYFDLFSKFGVKMERIKMLPVTASTFEHLALYNRVDIGLDPFPYNGTTTTCEALWMGVPVISLTGNRHAARTGTSILTRVGLPELIANTNSEYIEIAATLAKDIDRLDELREKLRQQIKESSLCDSEKFISSLEETFTVMWKSWCQSSK